MKPILKKPQPPSHLRAEFTEGCNLYCSFCPIQTTRKGPGNLKFMKQETVELMIDRMKEAGWHNKLELTGHGEPLLNKNYLTYVKMFREAFPKMYIFSTSNGGKLLSGKSVTYNIDSILEYVNVLVLEDYQHSGFAPKIIAGYKGKYKIYTYPEMQVYSRPNTKEHYIVVYPDISKTRVKERVVSNTACNSGPPSFNYINKTCHRPFREFDVTHDGIVIFCCVDWSREYRTGNIYYSSMKEIWEGRKFEAGRRLLHHEGRKYSICYGCDNRLYRIGLLPDRMGKFTLRKPSRLDYGLIARIEREGLKNNRKSPISKTRKKLYESRNRDIHSFL